jgi:hypothetical protein
VIYVTGGKTVGMVGTVTTSDDGIVDGTSVDGTKMAVVDGIKKTQ